MPMLNTPGSTAKVRGQGVGGSNGSQSFYLVTGHGPVEICSDGSYTQRYTFECDWPSLFQYMPIRFYSSSPDFPSLLTETASATYKTPGTAVVVVTYRGIPFQLPPGDEEMIVTTQEQPIETHPKFISDLAGKPSAPKAGAVFTGTDDAADTFVKFNTASEFVGIESYLEPTMTFRRNYADFNRPDVSSVGFIWGGTDLPDGGGQRNWLCTGITWRKYGGYYSINEDSLLSGAKGWNSKLYTR